MRAEGQQPVQCYSEEFRQRVVMKGRVIRNDCELSVRLMEVFEEECHFVFIGVEDRFLGGAQFGDGGDRTL